MVCLEIRTHKNMIQALKKIHLSMKLSITEEIFLIEILLMKKKSIITGTRLSYGF